MNDGDTPLRVVFGLLMAAVLGLLAWQLRTTVDMATQVELLQYQIEQLQCANEDDQKQNANLSRHWKLHGWARDEINDLRHKAGLDSSRWPDFD